MEGSAPPSCSRGLVPLSPFGLQDLRAQAWVPGSKNTLREGELGQDASDFTGRPQQLLSECEAEARSAGPPRPNRQLVIFRLRLARGPEGCGNQRPARNIRPEQQRSRKEKLLKEAQEAMRRAGRKTIFIGLAFLLTELFPNDIYLTVFDSSYEHVSGKQDLYSLRLQLPVSS